MPQVAALTVKVDADITSATRGLDAIEQKVTGVGGRLGQLFSTAGGFLLARGVEAVIGNIGQLASAGLEFEAQMANVNSIIKVSGSELQALSDQVLGLTSNPGITQGPADLAAGLYNIVSSGLEGAAALDTLEVSAMAATAGLTSTDIAAQVIVGTMNAYGQETYTAAQIADVLFKTVDSGVITFEELASNMGQVLAVGASLGVGVDQLGAAYAQMTLNAVPAAQAETQIAALMRSALQPTEALSQAVQKHGYASAEALIAAEGMPGYLRVLIEESDGSKEALLGLVGSTEAMNAATILGKDGVEEYNKLLFEMTGQLENGGALTEALEKQMLSANYALAKMKQQVTVAATVFMGLFAPGIRAGAEAFTGFLTGGVIPFTNVISQAVRGGFEFREVVDTLPQPLRRSVGALGSIAEAAGDVVRSFGERGLAGAFRTLTEGGEGRQILSALGAIADELVGVAHKAIDFTIDLVPRFGAWLWGSAGNVVDWALSKIPGMTTTPSSGLSDGSTGDVPAQFVGAKAALGVTLNLIADFGGWVWGSATSAVDWVLGLIPGTGRQGDGTGGPEFDTVGGIPAKMGVLFDLIANGATWIWGSAGDLGSWIYDNALNAGDWIAENVPTGFKLVAGGAEWLWGAGGDLAGWLFAKAWSAGTWVAENLPTGFKLLAGGVEWVWGEAGDLASWVLEKAKAAGSWVADGVPTLISTLADWGGVVWGEHGDDFSAWFKGNVGSLTASVNAAIEVTADERATAFEQGRSQGGGWADAYISGLKFAWDNKFDPSAIFGEIIGDGEGGSGGGKWIDSLWDPLVDALFPFSPGWVDERIAPKLAGFSLEFASAFKDVWVGVVTDIKDWILDNTPESIKLALQGDFIGAARALFGGGGDDRSSRAVNSGPADWPVPDLNHYQDYFGSQPYVGASDPKSFMPGFTPVPPSDYSIRASLELDTEDAVKKMADLGFADGSKKTLDNQFTATFDLDTAKAEEKNTTALDWGQVWADALFESKFDINHGPAALKYTDAFLWGDTWAKQVFTATFSVDLGPIESAKTRVAELAQEISDLLPHSPAKKGPLARPISFGYIADDLESTLDRMAGAAGRGMGRVGDAFGATLTGLNPEGRSGNGDTYNVTVNALKSDELLQMIENSERGGTFARDFPQFLREAQS